MPSPRTPPSRRPPGGGASTNGARGGGARLAGAGGMVMALEDPLAKVLGLDEQTSGPAAWLAYYLLAVALLVGTTLSAQRLTRLFASSDAAPEARPQEIDLVVDEPPPPPPAPAAEPKPELAPPPPPAKAAPHEEPPPAAAPAQAAKVLTQEPDPNEPVDLTGDTIVTGNADTYAGGVTAYNGTSTKAVRSLATPGGTPGGTGVRPSPAPLGPDRSRKASIGAKEWNVPFPMEADAAQIDEAYVVLKLDIAADGAVTAVRVLSDPGNGFGREARKYALKLRIPPALDRDGNPIASTVTTKVHFIR